MYNWLMFLAALGLVSLNALFVAAEFAWVTFLLSRPNGSLRHRGVLRRSRAAAGLQYPTTE